MSTTTEYAPLVWVDVETTGLDPEWDQLLEVCLVTTDSNLEILGEYDTVVKQPELVSMNPIVYDMHTRSGLLSEVRSERSKVLPQVFAEVVEFLGRNGVSNQSPLCGSTVHFDKAFLKRDMPGVLKMLHYRVVDVSSLKELVKRWHPESVYQKSDAHRAKDDILDSIKELNHYRRVFGL